MELKKIVLCGVAAITVMVSITETHAAIVEVNEPNYFVRPVLRIGDGEIIDGLQVNGNTEATQEQGVVGYAESTVNLQDGTVKMYAEEFAPTTGLQTFGSFGERLTITNGAGTDWSLGFNIEGFLDVVAGGPIINGSPDPTIFYDIGLFVYEAGQVNWSNFFNNTDFTPLIAEYQNFIDPIDNFSEFSSTDIFAEVFGSLTLVSNYEQYDVFAFTNVIVDTEAGDGIKDYQSNFLNTATYSQSFANGTDVFSSSGSFLGLTTPPPPPINSASAPASLSIFGIGLALMALRRRT